MKSSQEICRVLELLSRWQVQIFGQERQEVKRFGEGRISNYVSGVHLWVLCLAAVVAASFKWDKSYVGYSRVGSSSATKEVQWRERKTMVMTASTCVFLPLGCAQSFHVSEGY